MNIKIDFINKKIEVMGNDMLPWMCEQITQDIINKYFPDINKINWPVVWDEKSVSPELEQYAKGYRHGVNDCKIAWASFVKGGRARKNEFRGLLPKNMP